MQQAYDLHDQSDEDSEALTFSDFLERLVRQYQVECASGAELIRQFYKLKPHLLTAIPKKDEPSFGYSAYCLELKICGESSYSSVSMTELTNDYLCRVRYKYWEYLLVSDRFTGKLTSKMREEFIHRVSDLKNYEFSMFNIQKVAAEINLSIVVGVEESILRLFDLLSEEHSYYPECSKNIHYYNGWKTNKAHKVGMMVILPSQRAIFEDWYASKTFDTSSAYWNLTDIEKVLNYLDVHMTAEVDLASVLDRAERCGQTKNIRCKYFSATFYKKGTIHLKFNNEKLVEKFNIYASRHKGWLPPCYGKRKYSDMSQEEKAVVDDFQGQEAYEQVLAESGYYLADSAHGMTLLSQ